MAAPEAGGAAPAPEAPVDASAAPPGDNREAASRAFLTSIDAEGPKRGHRDKKGQKDKSRFRALEATAAGPDIAKHHADLTHLANTLDQRMAALLREHEKDFFLAYKTHMYTVQTKIKMLKEKADQEEAKTREDTKIRALEEELDWFMREALRLDELCKGYKKEVDKWKAKAESLDEDRRFLEDQIKGAKRQNKILRAAAERARSSAYSALMATRARTEVQERNGGGYPAQSQAFALTEPPPSQASRPRPASADLDDPRFPVAGNGARAAGAARSRTPDARQGLPDGPGASSLALAASGTGGSLSASALALAPVSPAGSGGPVLGNEAEDRYVQAIQDLKERIAREQHNVRMLQAARASQYSQKSEMEEFFLKCVDEARRDLQRRRHLTMHKEKSEKERVLEAMLNSEDILVCLYEKIFPHRTGIARSLGGPTGDDQNTKQPSSLPLEAGGISTA